jgi:hypothetical protein
MPFDRRESDYRAIELLLDERMQALLDKLWDATIQTEQETNALFSVDWAKAIEKNPFLDTGLTLSHSEKARLRLAIFFWNGSIPIRLEDPRRLDPENREKFIAAYRRHLDLPPQLTETEGVHIALRAMARAFERSGTPIEKRMAQDLRLVAGEDTQEEKDRDQLRHEEEQQRIQAEQLSRDAALQDHAEGKEYGGPNMQGDPDEPPEFGLDEGDVDHEGGP